MSETPAPKKRHRTCYLVARHEDGRVTRIGHPKPTRFIEGSKIHRMFDEDLGRDTFDGWTFGIQVGPPTPVYTSDAEWVDDRREQLDYEGHVAKWGICSAVFTDLTLQDAKARELDSPTLVHNYCLSYRYGEYRTGKTWVEAYQLENLPKPPPPSPVERATARAIDYSTRAVANTSGVDLDAVAKSLREALAAVEAAQREAKS